MEDPPPAGSALVWWFSAAGECRRSLRLLTSSRVLFSGTSSSSCRHTGHYPPSVMAPAARGSAAIIFVALLAVCSAGSDAPRGVALGFVFDPAAKCEPPCEHSGVCIRNNTCLCARGYEGETCQYGDVTRLFRRIICMSSVLRAHNVKINGQNKIRIPVVYG